MRRCLQAYHLSDGIPVHVLIPRPARRVDALLHKGIRTYAAAKKDVWVATSNQVVLTTALETGVATIVIDDKAIHSGASALPTAPLDSLGVDLWQTGAQVAQRWSSIGRFRPVLLKPGGELTDFMTGKQAGTVHTIRSADDLLALQAWAEQGACGPLPSRGVAAATAASDIPTATATGGRGPADAVGVKEEAPVLVMDAQGWKLQMSQLHRHTTTLSTDIQKIIPAENLIATFAALRTATSLAAGGGSASMATRLFAAVTNAADAQLMLEALESGTDGVLLRTNDAEQVRKTMAYVAARAAAAEPALLYATACVTKLVAVAAAGDRACVDLAVALRPGEGLLVGSFARCLFLVHSECDSSAYIASRPFRVNAGPVHAYVLCSRGRTCYLSELRSGDEVLVVDAAGRARHATVGRVKIESRPLVLVEAATQDGRTHSILLQNAETVKLVGPSRGSALDMASSTAGSSADNQAAGGTAMQVASSLGVTTNASSTRVTSLGTDAAVGTATEEAAPVPCAARPGWRTISVSELAVGDEVFVLQQVAARHTGIAISEAINEV